MRFIAPLIMVASISLVIIPAILGAGSSDKGQDTAQAVFYVH